MWGVHPHKLASMNENNPNNPGWRDAANKKWDAASQRAQEMKEQAAEFAHRGRDPYPDPPGKAGQMKYGCQPYDEEPTNYLVTLEYDLANSYYWSGNFCQDFVFFVCQWHPLIGIFASHPYHPWTKLERLKMFVTSTALTMVPAIAISKWVENNMPEDAEAAKKWTRLLLTLILVTLPDVIIGVVLYQLSIATTRCPLCSCGLWQCLHKFCSNCSLIIALACLAVSYWQLKDHPNEALEALEPLYMGKLYSLGTWFPIWFLLPCVGYLLVWRGERAAVNNTNNQPAAE